MVENKYNLNIPRYVDSFEEEDPVDLTKTIASLQAIEAKMHEADEKISSYCAELGIASPFNS